MMPLVSSSSSAQSQILPGAAPFQLLPGVPPYVAASLYKLLPDAAPSAAVAPSLLLPSVVHSTAAALSQLLPGAASSSAAAPVLHPAGTLGSPLAWEDISLGFPSSTFVNTTLNPAIVSIAGLASLSHPLTSHKHHGQYFSAPSMRYNVFFWLVIICEFNLLIMVILGCSTVCIVTDRLL